MSLSRGERVLRGLGVFHGCALMLGEMLRSVGQGRPLPFVLDDFLLGGGVVAASLWFRADDPRRRAALAAAWGANVGGLYPSFFGKLLAPPGADFRTNYSGELLTFLIGLALFGSLACLVATLAMKAPQRA